MPRLKQIKLAGFKSFVDPTTVALPSNLSGVVGPNGCGKSNIIDAVRWVMGESSARYLRGESMADVIFNGSNTRKPAGHAAIELHFDNTDGGIGGAYAQYAEIVIRRQVNLDGQSIYYLNGTACRRRDITDLFLGTGLGPRSYAIIEQGTISRLIEAKPEELRIYLEEAAGISKYKERRRETELRLQHTRDNLLRLTDLRDELQKQLDHLSKQAATAEKYQQLKNQEHELRAQLLALRAKNQQQQLDQEHQQIVDLEQTLEKTNTEYQAIVTQREQQQQYHVERADDVQIVQRQFYQYNTELARVEQTLQHQRERHRQLEQDLAQAQQEANTAQQQLASEELQRTNLAHELTMLIPQSLTAKLAAEQANQHLQNLELEMHNWQSQWDQFNQDASKITQQAQVEQTRIQHLEKHIAVIQERSARLQKELDNTAQLELPLFIQELQQQIDSLNTQVQQKQENLNQLTQQLQQHREQQQQQRQILDDARTQLQSLRGRYASLQALQEAALGKNIQSTISWLQQHQLQDNPRLAEKCQVESGWEIAVETVLSQYLEAICVDNIQALLPILTDLNNTNIQFVNISDLNSHLISNLNLNSDSAKTLLSTKLQAPAVVNSVLAGIYVAEDLFTAISLLDNLADHESVITRDGIWVGKGWLRMSGKGDHKTGVLLRERELADTQKAINHQSNFAEQTQQALTQNQQIMRDLENARDNAQKELSQDSAKYADLCAQLKVQQAQFTQTQQRKIILNQELQELQQQYSTEEQSLETVRQTWQALMQSIEQDALQRIRLQTERDQQREIVQQARQQAQQVQQQAHQFATQAQVLQTQQQAADQHCQRLQQQLLNNTEKQDYLRKQLDTAQAPEENLLIELNQLLTQQQQTEKILQEKRDILAGVDEKLRILDKQQQAIDSQRAQYHAQLEQKRIQQQTFMVRLQSLNEQLQEIHCVLTDVLATLPDEASEVLWEEQLSKTTQRIERLGPINLAAISEHASQSERKNYLDQQNTDLVTALTTLEDAIQKIDRETRARFKNIYEQVNTLFQQLFPRIFGGGNAYLELTGNDLLQTGVNVIARPPGKRNSTIHLLSGGEKALTAIALVFAIFQLNPAPFCMLDEVDAPLDDANIGRFCELVKEMSKTVQFVFISHNKLAIEMAEHLLGVTMNEPGVSRLVAVDVNAAMEMAAA